MNIKPLPAGSKAYAIKYTTCVGVVINAILAVVKIIVGHIGHSAALVADGIHSLSDLASDALVLLAARHGAQPADDRHPYGHARFETAATVVLGLLLAIVAIGIAWDAVGRTLQTDALFTPAWLTAGVAVVALVSKEWLYHYTIRTARRIQSRLLEANAWHHRSDGISSGVVLAGIVGAISGYPMLDALAAFIVAFMVGQIAWELISNSVKELVDTAVDDEVQQQITNLINHTDGVVNLHTLRTRLMGSNILVDAHIQVHPRLSVSEGHQIAETVEYLLKHDIENIHDVTIHIDPEDDENIMVSRLLPLRGELLQSLQEKWQHIPESKTIEKIDLHYLDGRIEVALVLPFPAGGLADARDLQVRFASLASSVDHVAVIRVNFT